MNPNEQFDLGQESAEPKEKVGHTFHNLRELLDHVAGKPLAPSQTGEAGLAEAVPFPFFAIVGQREMKLALLLGLINPAIGGVLLLGPRGTAKTTAVRSLIDLLPNVDRSLCYYGCLPEDIETGGIDAVCQDCAKKYGEGKALTAEDRVRLIEIPLNARLEDVIGGIDERLVETSDRIRIRRGILAQADRNLLYIDEVNLLGDDIIDSILDASAQGSYSVRRGPVSATYRARFVLIGSMNPEEGKLRPQILDRFGLRIIVRGLDKQDERLEAYHRVQDYLVNPHNLTARYGNEMLAATREIQSAKKLLPQVKIPDKVSKPAIKIVQKMGIDSLRAEITWFEAARAYTAADGRTHVLPEDLRVVAPMALRMRKSLFMKDFIQSQVVEEEEIRDQLLALEKKVSRRAIKE